MTSNTLRMSTMFLRTLREDPADADVDSAKLLQRAGYIRKAAPGIWTWLPLGLKVLNKIEDIIREEINGIGAQEVHFPALLPREPYEATHRWEEYGDNIFRLKDRHEADYLLAPTHEEMFTLLVKDMYSAMSGPMGGSASEEFLAPMPIGEDTFALAPSGKAWNVEALTTPELPEVDASNTPAASKEAAPDAKTIDNMIERANADHPRTDGREWQASDILKNVVITVKHPEDEEHDEPWREVIVVGVPGDRTVDMKRLEAQFAPAELEEATEEDLKNHPELVPGYIGPMVLGPQAEAAGVKNPVRYLVDAHVVKGSAWFTGADENEVDYYNLVYGRDFKADGVVEAVEVRHGDMSPDGSGPLSFERGVEIGQVFQLGLKYSKALDLKVLDQNGKAVPVWMGCYGIGVSRVLACIAETHHDEAGLAWPSVIAPAAVHVVATGKDEKAFEGAEKLVAELEAKGLEVIYDDRKKVSPGVKFKDAELIGVPLVAVVGRDYVNDGTIEIRDRNGENKVAVPAAEAAGTLADRFAALG